MRAAISRWLSVAYGAHPPDKIVDADMKIVRQANEGVTVGISFAGFVVGEGLLVDAGGVCHIDLSQPRLFSQFPQSVHWHAPLHSEKFLVRR